MWRSTWIMVMLLMPAPLFANTVISEPHFVITGTFANSLSEFGGWESGAGRFNDDMFDDVVLLDPYYYDVQNNILGKAYVYYGTAAGIDPDSPVEIPGVLPTIWEPSLAKVFSRGISSLAIGDLNGDGFDDLALGSLLYQRVAVDTQFGRGYVMILFSKSDGSGLDTTATTILGFSSPGRLGAVVRIAEVNGDTYDDLIATADRDDTGKKGKIYVFHGGTSFDTAPDDILVNPVANTQLLGMGVSDVNGDGDNDLVGYSNPNQIADYYGLNAVHVWYGGSSGFNQSPDESQSIPYRFVMVAGDVNDDGFGDIVTGVDLRGNPSPSANLTVIKGGSPLDLADHVEVSLPGSYSTVQGLWDMDFDGVDDLFVSLYTVVAPNTSAEARVLLGDVTEYVEPDTCLYRFVNGHYPGSPRNEARPFAADGDGDGFPEIYTSTNTHLGEPVVFVHKSTPTVASVGGRPASTTAASLNQNWPNPFNPQTTIGYVLRRAGRVQLSIYSTDGRTVINLVDTVQERGHHEIAWDGTDKRGRRVASGVYFYQIQVGDYREARRMVLLK